MLSQMQILGSDPTVITGSHNWSTNAEDNSDEYTLIIHDNTIANIYLQEFTERFNELNSSSIDELINIEIVVFPNPSAGFISLKSEIEIQKVNLYMVNGSLLETTNNTTLQIDRKGTYFLKIYTEEGVLIKKILVN